MTSNGVDGFGAASGDLDGDQVEKVGREIAPLSQLPEICVGTPTVSRTPVKSGRPYGPVGGR